MSMSTSISAFSESSDSTFSSTQLFHIPDTIIPKSDTLSDCSCCNRNLVYLCGPSTAKPIDEYNSDDYTNHKYCTGCPCILTPNITGLCPESVTVRNDLDLESESKSESISESISEFDFGSDSGRYCTVTEFVNQGHTVNPCSAHSDAYIQGSMEICSQCDKLCSIEIDHCCDRYCDLTSRHVHCDHENCDSVFDFDNSNLCCKCWICECGHVIHNNYGRYCGSCTRCGDHFVGADYYNRNCSDCTTWDEAADM